VAVDRERLVADLRALVRIPSVTGSEEAVAAWAADALHDAGLAVERLSPDLAGVRADRDWPGEEMPRTSLPIVIGRAGVGGPAAGGSCCPAISTWCRRATRLPGRSIRGPATFETGRSTGAGRAT